MRVSSLAVNPAAQIAFAPGRPLSEQPASQQRLPSGSVTRGSAQARPIAVQAPAKTGLPAKFADATGMRRAVANANPIQMDNRVPPQLAHRAVAAYEGLRGMDEREYADRILGVDIYA